jgi:hypothetical protein
VSDVFARIRAGAAAVTAQARAVRIHEPALRALGARIAASRELAAGSADPAHLAFDEPSRTLAYVLTLDAINFGSGWFPHLHKPGGRSGYFTIATALRAHFERHGPWDADALQRLSTDDCARIFGQAQAGPRAAELMALFSKALDDLGRFLAPRFGGRFAGPVEAAGQRAGALVEVLAEMPFYRDVARYADLEVPFYKRAQITVSDLAHAFGGEGPGRFLDRDSLTIFADNLVPHVLRMEGALVYDPDLLARIEAGEEIASGSAEEVEIRAVALHAVERLCEQLRGDGLPARAEELDHWLWNRGQRPEMKARPRHRTRTVYY